VIEFLLLAFVPGAVFGAGRLWLSDGTLLGAGILGGVFGLTFATVTVIGRRVLGQ
jgi:hypothetical protein